MWRLICGPLSTSFIRTKARKFSQALMSNLGTRFPGNLRESRLLFQSQWHVSDDERPRECVYVRLDCISKKLAIFIKDAPSRVVCESCHFSGLCPSRHSWFKTCVGQ